MSAAQENGSKAINSNALSDQPEEVRRQMMERILSAMRERGLALPTRSDAKRDDADSHELHRWLMDPRLGPALIKLFEAIAQVAAPAVASAAARGDMKRTYEMAPGHVEYFPTWSFWGRTFVRMDNIGSVPTVVMINDERFHLNPGEGHTKDGQWAAFPIRVVNTSELPGSLVAVTVT